LHVIWQTLATQEADPLVPLQALPHVPQFATLVLVFVSQPSEYVPLQSFHGAVHDWTVHVVPMHEGVPLAAVQTVVQEPQWFTSLVVAASQPSATLLLQLPQPAAHAMEQAPAAQAAEPWTVEQAAPQAPQFVTLVSVLVSQPLAWLPSQLPHPALQVDTRHDPLPQDSVAFGRLQTVPHVPQFVFVFRLVSHPSLYRPLQSAYARLQSPMAHAEATQAGVPLATWHALPHVLQLVTLVVRLVSQPLLESPSQSPRPAPQAEIPHTPSTQLGVPPEALQMCPHVAQLFTSTFVLVSQPFVSSASQFANPALQVMPHCEFAHAGVPFVLLQTVPHAPQLEVSVDVSASHPVATWPSQSEYGAMHEPMPQLPLVQVLTA
jgi:hypothetical protein